MTENLEELRGTDITNKALHLHSQLALFGTRLARKLGEIDSRRELAVLPMTDEDLMEEIAQLVARRMFAPWSVIEDFTPLGSEFDSETLTARQIHSVIKEAVGSSAAAAGQSALRRRSVGYSAVIEWVAEGAPCDFRCLNGAMTIGEAVDCMPAALTDDERRLSAIFWWISSRHPKCLNGSWLVLPFPVREGQVDKYAVFDGRKTTLRSANQKLNKGTLFSSCE